jgi:hypothetical protein
MYRFVDEIFERNELFFEVLLLLRMQETKKILIFGLDFLLARRLPLLLPQGFSVLL